MLDLFVICMQAGSSLEQAIVKAGDVIGVIVLHTQAPREFEDDPDRPQRVQPMRADEGVSLGAACRMPTWSDHSFPGRCVRAVREPGVNLSVRRRHLVTITHC